MEEILVGILGNSFPWSNTCRETWKGTVSGLYILGVRGKKKNNPKTQNPSPRICGWEAGPWTKVGHTSKDIGEEVKVRNGLSVIFMGVSWCYQKNLWVCQAWNSTGECATTCSVFLKEEVYRMIRISGPLDLRSHFHRSSSPEDCLPVWIKGNPIIRVQIQHSGLYPGEGFQKAEYNSCYNLW